MFRQCLSSRSQTCRPSATLMSMSRLTSLPPELLYQIVQDLELAAIFSFRYSCKSAFAFTENRCMWTQVLSQMESLAFPTIRELAGSMSISELRRRTFRTASVRDRWSIENFSPSRVRCVSRADDIVDAQLFPGGEWMMLLLTRGEMVIWQIGSPKTAFTLLDAFEPACFTGSTVSTTVSGELHVLCHCSTRLYIFKVQISTRPTVQLKGMNCLFYLSGVATFRHTCIAGDLLAVEALWNGRGIILVRSMHFEGPYAENEQIGISHDKSLCTLCIVSRQRLLVAHHDGIAIYEIPTMRPVDERHIHIVQGNIIWSIRFDTLCPGILHPSPISWCGSTMTQGGSLVLLGSGVVHRVTLAPEFGSCIVRTTRTTRTLDSEPICGFRHAFSVQYEWKGQGMVFMTCSYPTSDDLPFRLGSFRLPRIAGLIDHTFRRRTSFDEWTGRVALLFRDIRGRKQLFIMDVLQ